MVCVAIEAVVLYGHFRTDTVEYPSRSDSTPEAVERLTPPSGCNLSLSYTPPYFLGCHPADARYDNCQPIPLDEWLQLYLEYPAGSQEHRTAGIAEVSFVVGPDGLVHDPQLIRDPGHGRGYDLLRAFRIMERDRIPWEPSVKKDSYTNKAHPTSMRLVHRVKYDMIWAAVGTRGDH